MQVSAREAVKLQHYCEIDRLTAGSVGIAGRKGCDRDQYWAQFKVLLGMGVVLTGLLLNWAFMLFKSKLEEGYLNMVSAPMPPRISPLPAMETRPFKRQNAGLHFARASHQSRAKLTKSTARCGKGWKPWFLS